MNKKIIWIFLGVATLAMIYVMKVTGEDLKTSTTPAGILNLEFAYNEGKVDTILQAWSNENKSIIEKAKGNTYYDFIFLLCYGALLFYSCYLLSEVLHGRLKKIAQVFAGASFTAAIFDIFENTGMLISLDGRVSDSIAMITAICASIKWALVIGIVSFLLVGIFIKLAGLHKRTRIPFYN